MAQEHRRALKGMPSISDDKVKFENLLDRPIIIVERTRMNGQYGEYDQWLVDTGNELVYTNPKPKPAAEYRAWLTHNADQACKCVITAFPDEKTGYNKYRWEEWTEEDAQHFIGLKEDAARNDNEQVPF